MLTRDRKKNIHNSFPGKGERFFFEKIKNLRQMLTRNRPKKGMLQNQKGELSAQTRFFIFVNVHTYPEM